MNRQNYRQKVPPLDQPVDLSQELSGDYTSANPTVYSRHRLILSLGVLICFAAGISVGYWFALRSRNAVPASSPPSTESSAPSGVPELVHIDAELLVERRLLLVALGEAQQVVGRGVDHGGQVQAALPGSGTAPEEVPVRIRSNRGAVRVRSGGDEVRPVAPSIYSVRRSEPVEVEFDPLASEADRLEDLQILITPLLELEQYDPYVSPSD